MIERGDGWELRLGDCIEGMRSLADDSVDVTITDPPYSRDLYTRYRTNKGSGIRKGERGIRQDVNRTALSLASESIGAIDDILDDCAVEFMRMTRRWIVVFSDAEIAHRWRTAFGRWYVRTGVWVKPDAVPQMSGDRPGQGFETITIAHRPGRKRWNGGGRVAVWTHNTCKGIERSDHPCPKPISLMSEMVSQFSDAGELVLDAFTGSGTTGAASSSLGRRFIGWELNRDYFDIACRRLRGEEARPNPAQPSLFGGAP